MPASITRGLLVFAVIGAASLAPAQVPERRPIGEIEFFGYKGIDVERARAALPLHEGDLFPPESSPFSDDPKRIVGDRVRQAMGRDATDVAFVCCDDRQLWMIYIGLPGATSQAVTFNPAPTGDARLPPDVVRLNDQIGEALMAAVMRGQAGEDDTQGFALSGDPALHAKRVELRAFTLGRIAGIDEKRLNELGQQGHRDEIIGAASAH